MLVIYLVIGATLAARMTPAQQWFCPDSTRSTSPYELGEPSSDGGWVTEDPWSPDCGTLDEAGDRVTDYALLTVAAPVIFVFEGLSRD